MGAEGRKSKKEPSKPVYPAAKVDSWIVKSPRSNANTQYTKSVTKSFGRPTGDTHELILNSSAASHSGSPSGATTSPVPFSKAVMEKHQHQQQQQLMANKSYYEEGEKDYAYRPQTTAATYDQDALRLPLDTLKYRANDNNDDFEKVS